MMRLAGIEVRECPKFLSEAPDLKDHSIYFREEGIRIPLQLKNTISLIPTRIPAQDELKLMGTPDIKVMLLTPDSPNWNPHNNSYEQQEFDMTDHHGNVITSKNSLHIINDVTTRVDEPALLCNDLIERLQVSNVKVESSISVVNCLMENGINDLNVSSVKSTGAKSDLSPKRLSDVFDISLEDAMETLKITERLMPRNTKDITLDIRHMQDDAILRYKRLKWPLYTDTAFASGTRGKTAKKKSKVGTSVRGHTCF